MFTAKGVLGVNIIVLCVMLANEFVYIEVRVGKGVANGMVFWGMFRLGAGLCLELSKAFWVLFCEAFYCVVHCLAV